MRVAESALERRERAALKLIERISPEPTTVKSAAARVRLIRKATSRVKTRESHDFVKLVRR